MIATSMGAGLAFIFDRKFEDLKFGAFIAMAAQYFSGALIIKTLATGIPFFGSVVNATVSLATMEVSGWTLYLILNDGKEPGGITKRRLREYFGEGKKLTEEMKKRGSKVSWEPREADLPPAVWTRYCELRTELISPGLSGAEVAAIADELQRLLEPFRPQQ
ncbi:hypothetical protein ACFYYS_40455 [Streptomyces sp. NPDC002120]|uniref:hypothetical protein n=1 Tax=Streptomyces sp. NPDC002120 TaxID=3364631 RepID=UPI00368546D7